MPLSTRPVTRLLTIVAAIVVSRWLDARTGWPDFLSLPAAGLTGLALLDTAALPRDQRLSPLGWAVALAAAAVLSAIIFATGGR
jgi:hypothetical protein